MKENFKEEQQKVEASIQPKTIKDKTETKQLSFSSLKTEEKKE